MITGLSPSKCEKAVNSLRGTKGKVEGVSTKDALMTLEELGYSPKQVFADTRMSFKHRKERPTIEALLDSNPSGVYYIEVRQPRNHAIVAKKSDTHSYVGDNTTRGPVSLEYFKGLDGIDKDSLVNKAYLISRGS